MDNNNVINLPYELQLLVLSKINDTRTYLNSRLVCKNWYNELKDIKIFKDYNLFETAKIKSNLICIFDKNENLKRQIKFENFGYYTFQTFENGKLTKSIRNKPPFIIEEYKYFNLILSSKKIINIDNDKITNINYPILTNCLIS
jgi:hypothetical protein